jgi:hypothetical protein
MKLVRNQRQILVRPLGLREELRTNTEYRLLSAYVMTNNVVCDC